MKAEQRSWLLEMWIIKLKKWHEALRIYTRSGAALLRSFLFPAVEMRGLEKRLSHRQGICEEEVLRRAGKWFALLARLGLHPSCLVRSLTLTRVLREEGHDAHLVFGVRSGNGDMEGHCWVAVDGRALTEAPESFEELKYG
jgi:Transglutaminase-like superfamily